MNDYIAPPRPEDWASVGTRVSWGAILAGCMTGLGMYFLLATLGAAVGWSISDRTSLDSLQTGAIVWAFLTTIAAAFVGGVVTSLFTAGEDKFEGALHGVIMWATLATILLLMGSAGIHGGFQAMAVVANNAALDSNQNWTKAAQDAGVPAAQIDDWRRKLGEDSAKSATNPANQQAVMQSARRITWCAFAGTWLSMMAAAGGASVGAGPMFRLANGRPANRAFAS